MPQNEKLIRVKDSNKISFDCREERVAIPSFVIP